jgi:phosphatidylglycerophosphatase A
LGYHDPIAASKVKAGQQVAWPSKTERISQLSALLFRDVNTLAKAIATALGAGYSPIAPGTCGTVVAVPIAYLTANLPLWQYAIMVTAITAVAIWAADRADRAWGTHDSQRIVIDEVAGYLVTMFPVDRHGWIPLLAGFIAFRFFDIVKPPPVRWLDENLPGGAGVVLDDVGAGIQGAIVMWALDYFGALDALARL